MKLTGSTEVVIDEGMFSYFRHFSGKNWAHSQVVVT